MQTTRKKLVSVGIDGADVEIMQQHAIFLQRSLSETIRLVIEDFIKKNNLKEKYKK